MQPFFLVLALAASAAMAGAAPPRFELGLNTYEPSDGLVNGPFMGGAYGTARADHPGFLARYRVGYSPASFLGGEVQVHLDYQPTFKNNISSQVFLASFAGADWVKSQHTTLGLLWNWKYFGFGPELRNERYRAVKATGQELDAVRMNRLWWRFSLGYVSPPAAYRLVARVEVASTNQVPSRWTDWSTPSVLRGMAPAREQGLYAGVRF